MAVGDGETNHGQHIGDQEEDDLVTMVKERLTGITIRPYLQILVVQPNICKYFYHETGCPVLVIAVEHRVGVEQGGSCQDDGDGPDGAQHAGGGLDGEVG